MPRKDPEQRLEQQRKYQKANKEALLEKRRQRHEKQKAFILQAKDKPCADCGESYPYYVMDFDHVSGEKRFDVSRLCRMSAAWRTIKKELDKCEVVCSNCHRERTWQRKHGVRSGIS